MMLLSPQELLLLLLLLLLPQMKLYSGGLMCQQLNLRVGLSRLPSPQLARRRPVLLQLPSVQQRAGMEARSVTAS